MYFKEKNFVADMSICKTHPTHLQKFRTFLETTGSCITDDTLQDVKTILRGKFKMCRIFPYKSKFEKLALLHCDCFCI